MSHRPEWTSSHSFFVVMGGFILKNEKGRPLRPLLVEDISRNVDAISIPFISEREIHDRSKGDTLSKTLILFQTMWFLLQVLARVISGLPITELELVTVAFASLNILAYAFWYYKPLNVDCAISVPVSRLFSTLEPVSDSNISTIYFVDPSTAAASPLSLGSTPADPPIELIPPPAAYGHSPLSSGSSHSTSASTTSLLSLGCTYINPPGGLNTPSPVYEPLFGRPSSASFMSTPPTAEASDIPIHVPGPTGGGGTQSLLFFVLSSLTEVILGPTIFGETDTSAQKLLSRASERSAGIKLWKFLMRGLRYGLQQGLRPGDESALVREAFASLEDRSSFTLRAPTFYCGSSPARLVSGGHFQLLLALYLGTIHCLGWNFHFDTMVVLWLWRVSAILLTFPPFYFLLITASAKIWRKRMLLTLESKMSTLSLWENLFYYTGVPSLLLFFIRRFLVCFRVLDSSLFYCYFLARVVLVILPLILLRDLPPRALEEIEWTKYLPHVGPFVSL
ncbi:hypothetical protein V5O48_014497 [Marasmius crinis-equi]|uniref:Uncharacterized protein n=1 Tax=Marasmius crinis-equi TaxID=585013 RepID=A0ABR3EX47_9AGAR